MILNKEGHGPVPSRWLLGKKISLYFSN